MKNYDNDNLCTSKRMEGSQNFTQRKFYCFKCFILKEKT